MKNKDLFFAGIRDLIKNAQTEAALEKLLSFLKGIGDKEDLNKIILISAQFTGLKKDVNASIISDQNAQLQRNKINYTLLSTCDIIEKSITTTFFPEISTFDLPAEKITFEAERKFIPPVHLMKIAWLGNGIMASKSVCRINNISQTLYHECRLYLYGEYVSPNR